jgi:hypothetical protein
MAWLLWIPSNSWAQLQCSQLFSDSGVRFSNEGFEIEAQNDGKNLADLTMRLLRMTVPTLGPTFSEKLTLEKGELNLGENLGGGWSVEYAYFSDLREAKKRVFRLGKISVVKPNGDKVTLEKNPTSIDGLQLKKTLFTIEDLGMEKLGADSPVAYLKNLQVPVVIQGELLNSFLTWAPRMEHLQRNELLSDGISSLRTKSALRSAGKYLVKAIKNRGTKFFLTGLALYLFYLERGDIQDLISNLQDPWESIEEHTHSADLKEIFPQLNIGDEKKSKKTHGTEVVAALRSVNSLLSKETVLGGQTKIYSFAKNQFTELSPKKLAHGIQHVSDAGDDVIVLLFPESKRLLIVQGDEQSTTRVQLLGISQGQRGGLFGQIKALIAVDVHN